MYGIDFWCAVGCAMAGVRGRREHNKVRPPNQCDVAAAAIAIVTTYSNDGLEPWHSTERRKELTASGSGCPIVKLGRNELDTQ